MKLLHSFEVPSFQSTITASGAKAKGITFLPIIPSWNQILGMQHWARDKRKKEIANAILSALRASGINSSTKITCAKSTLSIAADTLDCYLTTAQEKRKLKSANKRLEKKTQRKP